MRAYSHRKGMRRLWFLRVLTVQGHLIQTPPSQWLLEQLPIQQRLQKNCRSFSLMEVLWETNVYDGISSLIVRCNVIVILTYKKRAMTWNVTDLQNLLLLLETKIWSRSHTMTIKQALFEDHGCAKPLYCTSKTNKPFCGLSDLRQQSLQMGGWKSHTVRMALDHENKDEAGFSYQTNTSHM